MSDMPFNCYGRSKEIEKSHYSLDEIRETISFIWQKEFESFDSRQLAILELILCLANEIHELKNEKK